MSPRTVLTLANGRGIDLRAPTIADVDWYAFAEHLAKENRFNGATPGVAYSVAQHQCYGAGAVLDATGDRTLAAYFAIHDTPEAVLKDDTTPKKQAIAEEAEAMFGVLAADILAVFDRVSERHDRAIHEAAGLPWPVPAPIAAQVKRFDLIMFVTEWRDLMRDAAHPDWDAYRAIVPLARKIEPLPWPEAQSELLDCWHQLLPIFQEEKR